MKRKSQSRRVLQSHGTDMKVGKVSWCLHAAFRWQASCWCCTWGLILKRKKNVFLTHTEKHDSKSWWRDEENFFCINISTNPIRKPSVVGLGSVSTRFFNKLAYYIQASSVLLNKKHCSFDTGLQLNRTQIHHNNISYLVWPRPVKWQQMELASWKAATIFNCFLNVFVKL